MFASLDTIKLLEVIKPTVVTPITSRSLDKNILFAVVNPVILASPYTFKRYCEGTDVPMPTNPFALTTKLSLST